MGSGSKHVKLDEEVHSRLSQYGKLSETYSQAVGRALDEAGVPGVDEDA